MIAAALAIGWRLAKAAVGTWGGRLVLVALAAFLYGRMTVWREVGMAAAAQKEREDTANEIASSDARETITALNRRIAGLEATLKENADAAAQDASGADCGLSIDGVRRVDRIGRETRRP